MNFRLLTRAELETVPGMSDPVPGSLFAVGMVDEKGVGAACGVFQVIHLATHADPLFVRPDLRNGGKLLLRLWEATQKEIVWRQLGPEVLVAMTETNPGQPTEALIERMCLKAGGSELKARFFVIPVAQ